MPRSPTTKLLDTKLLIWALKDGARRPPSYFICKAQDNICQKNMLYNIKTEKKEPIEPLKPLPLHHSFRHQKKMKIGHDEAVQKNDKDDDATEITQNNKRKNYIG